MARGGAAALHALPPRPQERRQDDRIRGHPFAPGPLPRGRLAGGDRRRRPDGDLPHLLREREFELTEELARELAARLCIPFVDALEIDPGIASTRLAGGYADRIRLLVGGLRLKADRSRLLSDAGAVLLIDDAVTYGSTFEACARALRSAYPHLRVFGAALPYTETDHRRERAEADSRPQG